MKKNTENVYRCKLRGALGACTPSIFCKSRTPSISQQIPITGGLPKARIWIQPNKSQGSAPDATKWGAHDTSLDPQSAEKGHSPSHSPSRSTPVAFRCRCLRHLALIARLAAPRYFGHVHARRNISYSKLQIIQGRFLVLLVNYFAIANHEFTFTRDWTTVITW